MGALGAVHQQQGDTAALLLGVGVLGQAVECSQRQIAGPVHGGIGTGVTGRAQEEVSEKAPAELGLGQRGVEGSAVVEPYLEAALPLAGQLAAELDGHRLLALDVGHGLHQLGPYAGGADAPTQHVAGQQLLRVLSQIVVKSVHLTGRTGEQHRPPPIQLPPHADRYR